MKIAKVRWEQVLLDDEKKEGDHDRRQARKEPLRNRKSHH